MTQSNRTKALSLKEMYEKIQYGNDVDNIAINLHEGCKRHINNGDRLPYYFNIKRGDRVELVEVLKTKYGILCHLCGYGIIEVYGFQDVVEDEGVIEDSDSFQMRLDKAMNRVDISVNYE